MRIDLYVVDALAFQQLLVDFVNFLQEIGVIYDVLLLVFLHLELSLYSRVPMVFDGVVGSPRQKFRYEGPSVA